MVIRDLISNFDKNESIIVLSYLLDDNLSNIRRNLDRSINKQLVEEFESIMYKREKGYPLQYSIGKWNFYGYDLLVDESVLIPRPETEILVELILQEKLSGAKLLDIGTGSGAIAISLAMEEKNLEVTASDISDAALKIAKKNAEMHKVEIEFISSDLFDKIEGKYDFIVSNPPYINEEDFNKLDKELFYEPKIALYGGIKGYEIYEKIINQISRYLNPQGKVFFEIGYDQGEKLENLLKKKGFIDVKTYKDYSGFDRIVVGRIE